MIEKVPEGYYSDGGAPSEKLSEYEIKELKEKNIEEAYYWYKTGYYAGSGYIIYRIADKWGCHDMGHCSCYGPIEGIETELKNNSPEDFLINSSKDYIKYVSPLVDEWRKRNENLQL